MQKEELKTSQISPKLSKELTKAEEKPSVKKYLLESVNGIYLAENHAKMLWQGNKGLIVQPVGMPDMIGKSFYLIGGNSCYGIIKILKMRPINMDQFRKLGEVHRISEKERVNWWPGKKTLYAYVPKSVKMFDIPKMISVHGDDRIFVDDVEFLADAQVPEFVKEFEDVVIAKNFVSLVDLQSGNRKLHFRVGGKGAPDEDYVPLYDLVLVKKEPKFVKVKEGVIPMVPFKPMELNKTFHKLEDAINHLYGVGR